MDTRQAILLPDINDAFRDDLLASVTHALELYGWKGATVIELTEERVFHRHTDPATGEHLGDQHGRRWVSALEED